MENTVDDEWLSIKFCLWCGVFFVKDLTLLSSINHLCVLTDSVGYKLHNYHSSFVFEKFCQLNVPEKMLCFVPGICQNTLAVQSK